MITELVNAGECLVVALCILGEAEDQSWTGKCLVADTIVNRAKKDSNEPYKKVCLAYHQYSCFNSKKQQLKLINRTADGSLIDNPAWKDCLYIAREICTGQYKPLTRASHYFNPDLCSPAWRLKMKFITSVGNHCFYEEVK